MLELLMVLGVDPQLLFWAFLGSICSIFRGPKNLWAALGTVMVGTIFGTGFGSYASRYSGVPPVPIALVIGLTGMILAKVIESLIEKWRPGQRSPFASNPENKAP